jgi:hypothetical protein
MGIFDVSIEKWDGEDSTNIYQKWQWDMNGHRLKPYFHMDHGSVMFEGSNKNLATFK